MPAHPKDRVLAAFLAAAPALAACGDDGPDPTDTGTDARDAIDAADGSAGDALDVDADGSPLLVEYTEDRALCADRNPERNVYWGDLHIHTLHSFDAWVLGTRGDPDDAYAFARGEALLLPPLDGSGNGTLEVRIDRPLDFAAVTDHSEYLAEIEACTNPESSAWDTRTCSDYRIADQNTIIQMGGRLTDPTPERFEDVCSEIDCPSESRSVWRSIRDAADSWYDRTDACTFTTFHAYEYSAATGVSNLHRNIIFRNDVTPDHTTSYFDEARPSGLWTRLVEDCLEGLPGCDVLAIPHNSNWSNGNLLALEYPEGATLDEQRELARLRRDLEPVVEIFQHKGDSECMNGLRSAGVGEDELCDFEKLRLAPVEDCQDGTGAGAMAGFGCVSRFDFVRYALKEGLAEEARLGVNPLQLGISAATDTHNATSGMVSEAEYVGHFGDDETAPEDRLADPFLTPSGIIFNPGGLTGVWAVENSRDAIFEAIRRREVFGTSGPRIAVRFFAGAELPAGLCDDAGLLETAYESGTPMGGILAAATQAPVFLVSALADPGTTDRAGTPLQRIQIIKGWLGTDGELHEQVFEVAGDPDNGASVDLATCDRIGDGFTSLCATWTDPDYDPAERAFYYARVVENPSCRWNQILCLSLPEESRPENCTDEDVERAIQERAWTSPIWVTPS